MKVTVATCQMFLGPVAQVPRQGRRPTNRCAAPTSHWATSPPGLMPLALVVAVCSDHADQLRAAGWAVDRMAGVPR